MLINPRIPVPLVPLSRPPAACAIGSLQGCEMVSGSRLIMLGTILAALSAADPSLYSDDVILNSGEVLEGKVDRAATDAANKGKTDPNQTVVVLLTDEAGTRKTIKNSDIKYIMPKKPSWELRKENLKWYDDNVGKQKDTIAGMESFARQCHAKKLDEQAAKAFHRVYELKRDEIKAKEKHTAEDYLTFAKWCHKNGLLSEESEQVKIALEMKREEAKAGGNNTKTLLDLANWCKGQGMEDEALKLYEEVAKADPNNATANTAIKSIKETSKFKLKGLVDEFAAANRALKIRVAIEDQASPAFMQEWKTKLESLSNFIFIVTEGQFFVEEWTLEDNTSNGKIIIEKGKMDWLGMNSARAQGVLAYTKGSGTPGWEVHCPGKTWEAVLCHEMFHGVFGLMDEYYQNPQCPCIMRSAPNPQKVCNPQTHLGGGRQKDACWNTIKARYKDVVSPNPKWRFTKEGIKGKGPVPAEECEGELTWGGLKLTKAPDCKVIVIDK